MNDLLFHPQILRFMDKKIYVLAFCLMGILLSSCVKDKVEKDEYHYSDTELEILERAGLDLPEFPYTYDFEMPAYLLGRRFGFPGLNRMDKGRATLGRVLFYDTRLSADNSISCASCHDQKRAFSDNVAFSDGVHGNKTDRNSYPISSTASTRQYYGTGDNTLFWDARALRVVDQSRETIQNPKEMGMRMSDLVEKLSKEEYYRVLFEKAYPHHISSGGSNLSSPITEENILSALEEFVLSIVLTDTKFDRSYQKLLGTENFNFQPLAQLEDFSDSENKGKDLFMDKCASCHGQTFTLSTVPLANNGLDITTIDEGAGDGAFKVPMLRNIELTAPYMHDGRFATLEEVIDFYSTGIQPHQNLHPILKKNGNPKRFNFTSEEKQNLIDFLKTLTDDSFADDVRFSDPF